MWACTVSLIDASWLLVVQVAPEVRATVLSQQRISKNLLLQSRRRRMSPTIKLSDNRSTVGLIPGDFSLPQPQRSIINLDFAKYLRTIWRAEQVKPVVFPSHHLVVGIKNTPQLIRSQICSIYTWALKLETFTSPLEHLFSCCSFSTAKSTITCCQFPDLSMGHPWQYVTAWKA